MFDVKEIRLQDILLSNHAIERAKNRLSINLDKNSFEFEIKIKELIKSGVIRYFESNNIILEFVYNKKTYKVISYYQRNNKLLIKTIMEK